MKRRLLNRKLQAKANELIFSINTALDTGDDFTIPTLVSQTYLYNVDWGDSNTSVAQTGDASHTYSTGGIYQITITGLFPQFYFANSGSKLKITSIDQWGDVGYSTSQVKAFQVCSNLTSIAEDCEWFNTIIDGTSMFALTGLVSIPNVVTFENLVNGTGMFNAVSTLTTLSTSLTLTNLSLADSMFKSTSISSIPSTMVMNALTIGEEMFENTNITALPEGNTLASLTNGIDMFRNTNLSTLPSTLTLASLTNGSAMFFTTSLASIPSGVVLPNLTNGANMFRATSITSVPSGMTLASLTNGLNMFLGQTLTTASYSQLINNIDANNANTGVTFHGGNSTYDSSAATAHTNLTTTKTWAITDGGLV